MKALIHQVAEPLVSASQVPYLVSVSAFETGGFKSPVLCRNNNLFGMRHPVKRPTTSVGDIGGYASYKSLEDSIKDFYLWCNYTGMPVTYSLKQFVRNMKKRSYFEADLNKYYAGCLAWYQKLY